MIRASQVERIKRAEKERDEAKDSASARRAMAVLDAALRNSSPEEIKEANPF